MTDDDIAGFVSEHQQLTRRHFLRLGATGVLALGCSRLAAADDVLAPELEKTIENLEPYFTPQEKFRDVSRGKPLPHSLSAEKKREVGLSRDTWKLEVIADPEQPAKIRSPFMRSEEHPSELQSRVDI